MGLFELVEEEDAEGVTHEPCGQNAAHLGAVAFGVAEERVRGIFVVVVRYNE